MFFLVSIDDDEVLDLDYTYFTHYIEDRMGFNTIFSIDGLTEGKHVLKIKSPIFKEELGSRGAIEYKTSYYDELDYSIPFYHLRKE